MRPTLSLSSFSSSAFEMFPMLVWLTMVLSRAFQEDRRAFSLSVSLSFHASRGDSIRLTGH